MGNMRSQILSAIRQFYLREFRPPTNYEFNIHNGFPCSDDTVRRLFGSYNRAIRSAGVEVSKSYDNAGTTWVECRNCGRSFQKYNSQIAKTKLNFCSKRCAATHHNTHKETGNRRSKLEKWIEEQLSQRYPHLRIIYNGIGAINAELDIYIPSLDLAFELNGIIHYKSIYGGEKLQEIRTSDERKAQACIERGIELITIDVSQLNNFSASRAKPFLRIVAEEIEKRI